MNEPQQRPCAYKSNCRSYQPFFSICQDSRMTLQCEVFWQNIEAESKGKPRSDTVRDYVYCNCGQMLIASKRHDFANSTCPRCYAAERKELEDSMGIGANDLATQERLSHDMGIGANL